MPFSLFILFFLLLIRKQKELSLADLLGDDSLLGGSSWLLFVLSSE